MAGFVRGRGCDLLGAVEGLSELGLRVNRGLVPPHTRDEGWKIKGTWRAARSMAS